MIYSIIALIVNIVLIGFGQLYYKYYFNTRDKKYIIMAVGLFVLAPIANFFALKEIPLDVTYIFTSFNIIIVLFLSFIVLNEKISINQLKAIAIILVGIVVYNL